MFSETFQTGPHCGCWETEPREVASLHAGLSRLPATTPALSAHAAGASLRPSAPPWALLPHRRTRSSWGWRLKACIFNKSQSTVTPATPGHRRDPYHPNGRSGSCCNETGQVGWGLATSSRPHRPSPTRTGAAGLLTPAIEGVWETSSPPHTSPCQTLRFGSVHRPEALLLPPSDPSVATVQVY